PLPICANSQPLDTTDTSVDTTDTSVTSTDPLTTDPTTDSTTGSSTSAGTGERIYEDVVSQLNPSADGYTFAQVDQSSIDNFLTYLSGVPAIAAADGFYGAVQIEKAGKPFNRVFAFVPKTPLPDGTMLDFANSVAAPAPVTESMVGGINGQRFTSTDNYEFFIAGDETNGLFMFGAQNDADLQAGVTAFFQSIKA
ncbi:MAG TPA: hypothetical protein PKV27_04705, partial [Ilumatobacteraceae bacterium]|nr:hypothetical protein [Ilumatobacteraceae bacterium]